MYSYMLEAGYYQNDTIPYIVNYYYFNLTNIRRYFIHIKKRLLGDFFVVFGDIRTSSKEKRSQKQSFPTDGFVQSQRGIFFLVG